MQRTTSSSRASNKNCIVDMLQKSGAKLLSMKGSSHDLPLYHTRNGVTCRREASSVSRSSEKWVHIIPLVVLFCLFALWWFSYPVDLEIKDGRITAVRQVDIPRFLNETRIDLTFLASAIPPYASIYHMQTVENETAPEPVGEID